MFNIRAEGVSGIFPQVSQAQDRGASLASKSFWSRFVVESKMARGLISVLHIVDLAFCLFTGFSGNARGTK